MNLIAQELFSFFTLPGLGAVAAAIAHFSLRKFAKG